MPSRSSVLSVLGAAGAAAGSLAAYDLLQRKHSVLRNYPVIGHMRYLLEGIRPELQQSSIERNWDGRPYDRDIRSIIYQRAKGIQGEQAFGTERDVNSTGYEYLVHTVAPVEQPANPPRALIGGPDCSKPYPMSLLNVSAMSFAALSPNAIRALNKGAEIGNFATTPSKAASPPTTKSMTVIWSGRSAPATSARALPTATSIRTISPTPPSESRSNASPSSSARAPNPGSAAYCPVPRSMRRSPRPGRSHRDRNASAPRHTKSSIPPPG